MLSLVFDAAGVAVFIVTILCFYNNNNNNNRCTYNAHIAFLQARLSKQLTIS